MSLDHKTSPFAMLRSLFHQLDLISELVKRDFISRYKGSFIGIAWSLFHPILMLIVYTFVFSVAFKARWGSGEESKVAFALVLFSGIIVHGFFAECLNNAPNLITKQPNFVKKIVFPLEILPWVTVTSALMHFSISFILLLAFIVINGTALSLNVLLVPLIMLPLVILLLGLLWIFSSLGVYFRDISQGMGLVTTLFLFISPVFYPTSALPQEFRFMLALNPITLPIEQLRDVTLWQKSFIWSDWLISIATSSFFAWSGFWWFQKTRKGFADVL